ncbi:MAG TPA: amidase family protein [Pseudonocardiaceae bacterium]|nr:amidase family protein [Pseudonocardiaceae bacterium]
MRTTSAELTERCLARIEAGDTLVHAVLAVDPTAGAQAEAADRRADAGRSNGPLDGIPVLLKDNIDTAGLATTIGSRVLTGAPPDRDAAVVTRLRACGAVVLGKTNLSEWSNFRSAAAVEGWSAVGGQTSNPHVLGHSPWGSSSGSAVAVATGMAPLALGTETDGSVVGPAGVNGVVGVKPELGLLPMTGIAPISRELDTVGVFAVNVGDAAACLAALAGTEPFGGPAELRGRRLGVWCPASTGDDVSAVLADALAALRSAGASIVPLPVDVPSDVVLDGLLAMYAEFRDGIEAYLRTRRGAPATVSELITAHRADPVEMSRFGLDLFDWAATLSEDEYESATAGRAGVRQYCVESLAGLLVEHDVEAILAPTNEPAWPIDHEQGDGTRLTTSTPAALAGRPNVSVPIGRVGELPIGLSVFGPAHVRSVLPIAAAVERTCGAFHEPAFARTRGLPHPHVVAESR